MAIRFEALGPVRVFVEDREVKLRPAQRRLLASLLLDPATWVSTDTLVDRMWGERPPATASSSLQVHMSAVRKQVPGVVATGRGAYLIDLDGHDFDVPEFTAMVAGAVDRLGEGRLQESGGLASRAAAMWRGLPYPELEGVAAASSERARLGELVATANVTLAKALMLQGRVSESIAHLTGMVQEQPYDEAMWEVLIHAYYLAGRQADALAAFREATRILGEELGLVPGPRLRLLEEKIFSQDPDLMVNAPSEVAHNLPGHGSSFVGRDREVDQVVDLLWRSPLVTITGPPGVGKTRLATEAAARCLGSFPAGVWLARLAGAWTEADVAATIATTMSVTGSAEDLPTLFRSIGRQPSLLILDSCEHLLPHIRRFLGSRLHGSALKVLATSRSRVGSPDESVLPLRGLAVPVDPAEMWESPALRLLADRVRAVDPEVDLDDSDPLELIELCRRTGGMPLALELTARWVPSLDLRAAIDLTLVSAPTEGVTDPPHHSSVASAIAWSVALLDPRERKALAAASVFCAGFTAQAFGLVCLPDEPEAQVHGALARLVESSLLAVDRSPGGVRYRMLEPIRDYGASLLALSGDVGAVPDRHAHWFVDRARSFDDSTGAADRAHAMTEVEESISDHRSAMRHLLGSGEAHPAAEIAVGLQRFWTANFLAWEGRSWLEECLSAGLAGDHLLRALEAAGTLAFFAGDYGGSVDLFHRLGRLAAVADDRRLGAVALLGMGRVEISRRPSAGRALLEEALGAFGELEDVAGMAECLLQLGIEDAQAANTLAATSNLTRAAELFERSGNSREASVFRHLSVVAWHEDDEVRARAHLDRAERAARQSDDRRSATGTLIQRALVEGRWGSLAAASEAALEALRLVSGLHGVYFAQTALGALPVLIATGDWRMADRLLHHCERIYREHGWAPLGDRSQAARQFRAQVDESLVATGMEHDDTPVTSDALGTELTGALRSIATR